MDSEGSIGPEPTIPRLSLARSSAERTSTSASRGAESEKTNIEEGPAAPMAADMSLITERDGLLGPMNAITSEDVLEAA